MHLKFRNVNSAFHGLVSGIHSGKIQTEVLPSRNGEVLQIEEPLIVTYEQPRERVLFNAARDANVFFHLYESLWMLAGRNDVAPLAYYNSGMTNYSDDGQTLNGAYGYRWRHTGLPIQGGGTWPERDQLEILIDHLKCMPESRRAVLSMWNVEDDLLKIGGKCNCADWGMTGCTSTCASNASKDVCCNVCAMFLVELGECQTCGGKGYEGTQATGPLPCIACRGMPSQQPRYLNMTVINRSNDLIWGMLGANIVHFSFLQEYVAAALGIEVGVYHQISNNAHVYTDKWEPLKWLNEYKHRDMHSNRRIDYPGHGADGKFTPGYFQGVSLVTNRATFDKECRDFVEVNQDASRVTGETKWDEPFLQDVAQPAMNAFHGHKLRNYEGAQYWLDRIAATDWQIACTEWIERRKAKWEWI